MEKNQKTYNSGKVVHWYSTLQEITPVEAKVFEEHRVLLLNARLLDIGIGGGRTSVYLKDRCKKYVGIDYSQEFIKTTKHKLPELDLRVMDARDLSAFETASFDFVNFSFNGIDYVDLRGREKILAEIARVLKPQGIFFFSTHNKNHPSFNRAPWSHKENGFFTNVKTLIKLFPFLLRKKQNRKHETFRKDYAIINDSAHNYKLLTFYSSPEFLRTQLAKTGFSKSLFYSKKGERVKDELLDDWIFVLATRN